MATETNPESRPASTTAAPPAPTPAASQPYWGTTLVLLAGTFISVLDFFIVNVAVPSIQRDLRASSAGIEWVVAGFARAYGSVLIIGGRLGDIFGRRRLFVLGLSLFVLSSAVCGIAPNIVVLVVGRLAQGLSAALLAPQILAILGATFAGSLRARAFNAYGVTMGLAAVFGQLIGGVLIQADPGGLQWRSCFLINIPIGIVPLALVPKLVPAARAPGRPGRDVVGMILLPPAPPAIALRLNKGGRLGGPTWWWRC